MTPEEAKKDIAGSREKTLQETAAIAKHVLIFMAKNNISLTPRNYTVWFAYHFGSHEELERDVKEHQRRGAPFDEELTRALYERYFGDPDKRRIMELVEEQASKILKEIIESILTSVNDKTAYSKKLSNYSRALSGVNDSREVRRIVKDLISDMKAMEQSNARLRGKLEKIAVAAKNLKKQIKQKEKDLMRDPLTGLGNRRALTQMLQGLHDEFMKSGAVFSIIMCDINSFKKFNDQYGHMIGDEALQIVSATLEENTKGRDFVGRYGGDEFIILLPMTSLYSGSIVAENLRKAVSEKRLKLKGTGASLQKLSISVGVSQIRQSDTIQLVLERADAALSLAKKQDRTLSNPKTRSPSNALIETSQAPFHLQLHQF